MECLCFHPSTHWLRAEARKVAPTLWWLALSMGVVKVVLAALGAAFQQEATDADVGDESALELVCRKLVKGSKGI